MRDNFFMPTKYDIRKTFVVVLIAILMLFQSNNAMSWGEEFRQAFVFGCMDEFAKESPDTSYRVAKSYCNCTAREMSDVYTVAEMQALGVDRLYSEPLVEKIVEYCILQAR